MTFSYKTQLANQTQSVKSSEKKGNFPRKNDEVHVELEEFDHVFKCIKDLWIHDAIKTEDGLFYGFAGQQWDYLITQIPREVYGFWETRRNVHIQYLLELEEAIEKGEIEVKTIFGWKRLEGLPAKRYVGTFKKMF